MRAHALQSLVSYAGVPDITDEAEVDEFQRTSMNKLQIDVMNSKVSEADKDALLALEVARNDLSMEAANEAKVRIIEEKETKMEESIDKLKRQVMEAEVATTADERRLVQRIQNLAGTVEREIDMVRNDQAQIDEVMIKEKKSDIAASLMGEIPEVGSYLRSAADAADGMVAIEQLSVLGTQMDGERHELHKDMSAVMAGIESDVHRTAIVKIDELKKQPNVTQEERRKLVGVEMLNTIEEKMKSIHQPSTENVGKGRTKNGGLFGFIGGIGLHEIGIWAYYNPTSGRDLFTVMLDTLTVRLSFRVNMVENERDAMRMIEKEYGKFVQGQTGEVDLLHDSVQIQHTKPVLVGRFGDQGYERMVENFYNLKRHAGLVTVGTSRHARRMISDWLVNGPIVHSVDDQWYGAIA